MTTRLLSPEHIIVPLEATTLAEAQRVLLQRCLASGALRETGTIERELAQGGRGTVRIAPDIALPHYRTDAALRLVVTLAVSKHALDTGDPEWQPGPRIVVLVLAPTEETSHYLQAVSALVRALRQPDAVTNLLAANSPAEVMAIPAIKELAVRSQITAADLITTTVESVVPETPVREAVDILLRSQHDALPVLANNEVVGVVTEADILNGLAGARGRAGPRNDEGVLPPLRVRDVMTRSVLCAPASASLDEVARLMINKDVGEIPIVAEGTLVGLVRRVDILRSLYGR